MEIPESEEVNEVLLWALQRDKYIVSMCHDPASLLAAVVGERAKTVPSRGTNSIWGRTKS
jgi:molecular chaperone Hsp31 and glyoxalase 3